MRILMISARMPPTPCGVGDHCHRLAKDLVGLGHEVVVLTGVDSAAPKGVNDDEIYQCLPVINHWSQLQENVALVKSFEPDAVLIHWVPHQYHPKGLSLAVPRLAQKLANDSLAVNTMLHELWIDADSLKRAVGAWIQKKAVQMLVGASRHVGISTRAWIPLVGGKFDCQSLTLIPVGSNIDPRFSDDPIQDHGNIDAGDPVVLLFGLYGSGKDADLIEEVWRQVSARDKKVKLVIVGTIKDQDAERWKQLSPNRVFASGYLSEAQVSAWLTRANLLLAPFTDGGSTRRGSLLAALAHGTAVVTTTGRLYDAESFKHADIEAVSHNASALCEAVLGSLQRQHDGEGLKRLYSDMGSPASHWHRILTGGGR